MVDLDRELQERLDDIENGATVSQAAAKLSAEALELQPLIHTVATIRDVPHPVPSAQSMATLQQKMDTATREMQRSESPRLSKRSFNAWLLASGMAAVSLALICLFVTGVGFWMSGPLQARAVTLHSVVGDVEFLSAVNDDIWQVAKEGNRLSSGDVLRTGPDSAATLVFFDGSQTSLGPNSELVLTQVDGSWGNVLQVTLEQVAGTTNHRVVPLRGEKSQFFVNTPAGQASVHGTSFSVAVDVDGHASFAVDAGEVQVLNADQSVSVVAGQATVSLPDEPPAEPVYQFILNDELTAIDGDVWSMSGVSFRVTQSTLILGDPQVGDYILARGRILEDGWVADFIQHSPEDDELVFQFSGVVEEIGEDSWLVNGSEILVNEVTEVNGDIEVGDAVRVTYLLLDGGRWLALKIENLAFEVPPPLSTQVNCTGAEPQPKAQKLAEMYDVPYEEIMSWFCQGFGFGEIDLAYELNRETGISVEEIFDLRKSGLGWGEIKMRLAEPTFTPTPVITATSTVTVTVTPVITVTLPVTVTATPVFTVTVTPTPLPTQITDCTGSEPQPKAQKLAQQYGVPYEEIMGWFCQGFGFGEIDLAYSLGLEGDVPVADIFAMKQSGMGWGNIKKELAGEARKPKNDKLGDDKDKDKDQDRDQDQDRDKNNGQDKERDNGKDNGNGTDNSKDKDKNKDKDKGKDKDKKDKGK